MRRLQATLLACLLLALAAWDTRVISDEIWRSTYFKESSKSIPEHSTLADLALTELGVVDLFGVQGSADVTVVDLNSTFFREDELGSMDREGDDRRTRVEERLIPQPARFAGLPDYSYGPADWLNKNLTCPIGGPPGYTRYCHDFIGWLGSLNSVHFGSQATQMYARYHTLALNFAERARAMRTRMTPEERLAHADALKEAEHQALVYEGYAQHFLQDRWAIGHMWERWDGPDRTQIDDRSMVMSLAIGAVAGFIHGSESSTGSADAMSSPLSGQGATRPMEFRHVSRPDLPPVPAVGDERLADMRRGAFGKGYGGPDQPLDVGGQRREMLACSKAGWAEVIRALGPGDRGGFGAVGAQLAADAPEFRVLDDETCWDMWATNRSMYEGLVVTPAGDWKGATGLSLLAQLRVRPELTGRGIGESLEVALFNGSDLSALGWRMWRRQLLDPDGTDLARGGIGVLWNAQTGDKAGLPIYAEPLDPAALPDQAIGGVDRQTLYGAFSRAHSDHWGGYAAREMLDRLRRSDRDRMWDQRQQTCQFVADMAWQGTHPSYSGRMARRRTADGKPVRSLAHIRTGPREAEEDDPADPFYLDQGYVSRTEAQDRAPAFGSKAAANWCARVPVVRLSRDPALRDQNIVQVLAPDARRIELIGENFGSEKGRVLFFEDGRLKRDRGRVIDWSERRIQVDFRPGELRAGRDHLIEIRTDDGRRSVGLFIVRVRPDEEEPAPLPVVAAGCDATPPPVPAFDMAAAISRRVGPDWNRADPDELAAAIRAAAAELAAHQAGLREFLLAERACIAQARPAGMRVVDGIKTAGRRQADREAAAHYSRSQSPGGSKHCAVWTGRGQPIRYVLPGDGFGPPEDIWTPYVDEIDGVIQLGRFAETHARAMALAVERRASPVRKPGDFDLRITDPAELLARHYSATGPVTSRFYNPPLVELSTMRAWSAVSLGLYEITAEGIVARRAYEKWLTVDLARGAVDPLDAFCRLGNPINASGFSVSYAPLLGIGVTSDSYWRRDGRRYDRIGWPSRASASGTPTSSSGPMITPAPLPSITLERPSAGLPPPRP